MFLLNLLFKTSYILLVLILLSFISIVEHHHGATIFWMILIKVKVLGDIEVSIPAMEQRAFKM